MNIGEWSICGVGRLERFYSIQHVYIYTTCIFLHLPALRAACCCLPTEVTVTRLLVCLVQLLTAPHSVPPRFATGEGESGKT